MNKFILDKLLFRFNDKQTKFKISSLSYYSILALIPTLILTVSILRFFRIEPPIKHQTFLSFLQINTLSSSIVFFITIFMLSRVFFILIKDKFSMKKSLFFALTFSLLMLIILSLFFMTYTIKNIYLNISLKLSILFCFFFLLIHFLSKSNIKYTLIFSSLTAFVSYSFFYLFSITTSFFVNYENYYGLLAPTFIIILGIHVFINIVFFVDKHIILC